MNDRARMLREKLKDASSAIFTLEQAIGPSGNEERSRIYAVRADLHMTMASILARIDDEKINPAT